MSGVLSAFGGGLASSAASLFPPIGTGADWRDQLQPASFRGVAFEVWSGDLSGHTGGARRVAVHQFALRDTPETQDLGRDAGLIRVRAIIVGDDYITQRQQLVAACRDSGEIGTLVTPTLGRLRVRCTGCRVAEEYTSQGMAVVELQFVEAGLQPGQGARQDTASGLLARIASLLPIIRAAYSYGALIERDPGVLGPLAGSMLADAGASLLTSIALPSSIVSGISSAAYAMSAAPTDTDATATAVTSAFNTAAQAMVDAPDSLSALAAAAAGAPAGTAVDGTDPVIGRIAITQPADDPTYGLAAMATWTSSAAPPNPQGIAPPGLPVPTGQSVSLAQAQVATVAALTALMQGAATAAVALIYAQTDWVSADAAQAARETLIALMDAQIDAAADSGNQALALAWTAVETIAVQDLTQRAQALPRLASYAAPASLPAVVLAQRLYQDATRAEELVALNAVPHPLFMPAQGRALSR